MNRIVRMKKKSRNRDVGIEQEESDVEEKLTNRTRERDQEL